MHVGNMLHGKKHKLHRVHSWESICLVHVFGFLFSLTHIRESHHSRSSFTKAKEFGGGKLKMLASGTRARHGPEHPEDYAAVLHARSVFL